MEISPRSQLEQAQAAFDRGDYAKARRLAAPLTHASGPTEETGPTEDAAHEQSSVAEEARELLLRLTPHRITKLFFALTLLLLSVITFFAYSQ